MTKIVLNFLEIELDLNKIVENLKGKYFILVRLLSFSVLFFLS